VSSTQSAAAVAATTVTAQKQPEEDGEQWAYNPHIPVSELGSDTILK